MNNGGLFADIGQFQPHHPSRDLAVLRAGLGLSLESRPLPAPPLFE